jgi:dipeptidyl aminopeptidase/acylaminoacyl peptidase
MEPYDHSDLPLADKHLFRLMVLGEDRRVRVLETTTKEMLSAPAYSPDGKQLCYVRVRMMSEGTKARIDDWIQKLQGALARPGDDLWALPTSRPADTAASQPTTTAPSMSTEGGATDLALPSGAVVYESMINAMLYPAIPGELVLRDVKTERIISSTPLELSILGKDGEAGYLISYATMRPQFSLDGRWIHVCAGNMAFSINPTTGEKRGISVAAPIASLSPDGDTLAILAEGSIAFAQTDGSSALYKRWDKHGSYSGLAWLDRQTLAILEHSAGPKPVSLHLVARDGSIKRSIPLELDAASKENTDTGELAIAPDGKNVVVAYQHDTYFLDAEGKQLGHWHHDQDLMVQPTFSPDASRVACKYMTKADPPGYGRVAAIVFFSPDGKELSRVPVPAVDPTTTRGANSEGG